MFIQCRGIHINAQNITDTAKWHSTTVHVSQAATCPISDAKCTIYKLLLNISHRTQKHATLILPTSTHCSQNLATDCQPVFFIQKLGFIIEKTTYIRRCINKSKCFKQYHRQQVPSHRFTFYMAYKALSNHGRSQGGVQWVEKLFRRNLQGKFVSAPAAHQVHPRQSKSQFLGHFLAVF